MPNAAAPVRRPHQRIHPAIRHNHGLGIMASAQHAGVEAQDHRVVPRPGASTPVGVMWRYTDTAPQGRNLPTPATVKHGRSDLVGPLSQYLIGRLGTVACPFIAIAWPNAAARSAPPRARGDCVSIFRRQRHAGGGALCSDAGSALTSDSLCGGG